MPELSGTPSLASTSYVVSALFALYQLTPIFCLLVLEHNSISIRLMLCVVAGKPQCHCREGFSGQRCEVNFTQQEEMKDSLRQVCKDLCSLLGHNSAAVQPFDVCR